MNPVAAETDNLLVEAESVTQFTWDYEPSNQQLTRLYEKGKVRSGARPPRRLVGRRVLG